MKSWPNMASRQLQSPKKVQQKYRDIAYLRQAAKIDVATSHSVVRQETIEVSEQRTAFVWFFAQEVDWCLKDCDKQRLQTTVSINLWKIFAGNTGDWFDVKTASICTTELWDALKSFILTSFKIKVAPYPIRVSLDSSSERSQKHVVCAALCASWRLEYGDWNWLNRLQGASDARADDNGRSNRPTPTHRFCHSAIFHPITPYNVWFFWVSRHRSIILAKKWKHFWADFEKFQEMCETWIIENVSWSQKRLGFLPSSLWKVFLKLVLQVNPIPIRKKQRQSISSSRF